MNTVPGTLAFAMAFNIAVLMAVGPSYFSVRSQSIRLRVVHSLVWDETFAFLFQLSLPIQNRDRVIFLATRT